ncbi:RNA polymerase sigma factor, sigma-70 family [Pseudomonas sp. GM102]|nr:RNA polymerase sigma factor, sigma-70 family [Pseudomonas sp. GM102]
MELNSVQPEVMGSIHLDVGALAKNSERKLRSFITQRVFNAADVDDLMQMTYLEALRNQHKFIGASKPETWLFGIAMNLVRNHFKCMYSQPQCSELEESGANNLEHGHDPSNVSDHQRVLSRTLKAIGELSEDMRNVMTLVVETDISYQDAADSLGIPIGTVRSRLSRAREQLKASVFAGAVYS